MKTAILQALKSGTASLVIGTALISSRALADDTKSPSADDQPMIIVTGTLIKRPELVSQSPLTSITAADIKATGATRIEDVLNAMPQAFVSQTSTMSNGSDGTATANLRNIGDTRTLVLVNGLRLPQGDPVRNAGSTLGSAADLNMIPSFMVKSVEVLTGGASSTYGADAVAGVVNFVLDDKMEGFKFDVQGSLFQHNNNNTAAAAAITSDPRYGAAQNGIVLPSGSTVDGGTYTVSGAWGTKLADGQGHFEVFGSYHSQAAVLLSSRDFSSCPLGSNEIDNGPGTPSPTLASDLYCSGSSNTARTSMLINGGAGGGLGNPAGTRLIVTPGSGITTYNLATDAYNFNSTGYFQRPDERYNAGAFFNYDVNDKFKPYASFLFMKDTSVAQIAPSGTFNNVFNINCSNPYLSAAQGTALGCTAPGAGSTQVVQVALAKRNVEGGGRQDHLEHTDARFVLGSKGDLGDVWSYDAHYQYGVTGYSEYYLNDFSRSRVQNAINGCLNPNGTAIADTSCQGYNIFSGTTTLQPTAAAGVTAAALGYVSTPGYKSGYIHQQVANATVNGDLGKYGVQMPWADKGVALALGSEWRRESLALHTDNEFTTGDLIGQGGTTKSTAGDFSVWELFGEANAPLVSHKPGFEALTLTTAYRYSHYTSVGGASTWKVALSWSPLSGEYANWVHFRGSIAQSTRAPTIGDLYAPSQLGLGGSSDICAQRTQGRASSATLANCLYTAGGDSNFAAQWAGGTGLARNPASQYNSVTGGASVFGTQLRPETAITKTIGIVFEPKGALRGFTATVDYYDINLRNRIGTDGYATIFNECYNTGSAYYCGLIHRDPANGSLWLTPNGYITDPVYNGGHLKTNGIDFTASYTHHFANQARLTASFAGTYMLHEKTEVMTHNADGSLSSSGYYDCVGYYDDGSYCGVPNPTWRHNLRLTYAPNDKVAVTGNWRHIGSTTSSQANPSPLVNGWLSQPYFTPADSPNSRIPNFDYLDLSVVFTPTPSFEWRLGMNNIADRNPPVLPGGEYNIGNLNGNSFGGLYDVLGRTLFMGVTVKF